MPAHRNKATNPRPTGIGFTHPKATLQVGKADKNDNNKTIQYTTMLLKSEQGLEYTHNKYTVSYNSKFTKCQ